MITSVSAPGHTLPSVSDSSPGTGRTASVPAVRVVETETPSCDTVGQCTDATIVVTTGLLEQLDSDELSAVLAHELPTWRTGSLR